MRVQLAYCPAAPRPYQFDLQCNGFRWVKVGLSEYWLARDDGLGCVQASLFRGNCP